MTKRAKKPADVKLRRAVGELALARYGLLYSERLPDDFHPAGGPTMRVIEAEESLWKALAGCETLPEVARKLGAPPPGRARTPIRRKIVRRKKKRKRPKRRPLD